MNCKFCEAKCQKAGRQKNGQQKLYCTACKKHQQENYTYSACKPEIIPMIPKLNCEGVGIRSMARILKIAVNTVLKYIKKIAGSIPKPPIPLNQQEFEVDELRTYIGYKGNEYLDSLCFKPVHRRSSGLYCGQTLQTNITNGNQYTAPI